MSKRSRRELKDVILEQSFTIEALEEEISDLEEELQSRQNRIVELIRENDRLTITYEPYRPEGSEHYELDFYGLIEENESLTQNILDKMVVIEELDELVNDLTVQLEERESRIQILAEQRADFQSRLLDAQKSLKEKPKKHKKVGVISFDFWPWRDWFRLSYHKWNPGMAAQLCIGPLRLDWFAD